MMDNELKVTCESGRHADDVMIKIMMMIEVVIEIVIKLGLEAFNQVP